MSEETINPSDYIGLFFSHETDPEEIGICRGLSVDDAQNLTLHIQWTRDDIGVYPIQHLVERDPDEQSTMNVVPRESQDEDS